MVKHGGTTLIGADELDEKVPPLRQSGCVGDGRTLSPRLDGSL